jgi:TRAP-type C4-dicarboxylate transport system permease large subunit
MLLTSAVVLVILWLSALVSGYTMDGNIHILLLAATVMVVIRESFRDEDHFSDLDS